MQVFVKDAVREALLNLAIAQYKMREVLGICEGPTGILASIHSEFHKEDAVQLVYEVGELEKLTTDVWEAVKPRGNNGTN